MKKLLLMLMVLVPAVPVLGAIKAQNSYDGGIGGWDIYDGDVATWTNYVGTGGAITNQPGGNGSFPAGNSAFAGCGDFTPNACVYHHDSRSSGEPLWSTNEERTFEMWISPRVAGLATGGGGTYGGALLVLDGNGLWANGNLFFFNNGVISGQQVFFQSTLTGTVEGGVALSWAANSWHHIALSWDSTHFVLGLDGTVVHRQAHGGLGAWSFGSSVDGYMMGWNTASTTGSHPWNGWVDDITVSDTGHYAQHDTTYPVPTAPVGSEVPPLTCQDVWDDGLGFNTDLDKDCYIGMADLLTMTNDWLRCFDPCDASCEKTWSQRP